MIYQGDEGGKKSKFFWVPTTQAGLLQNLRTKH